MSEELKFFDAGIETRTMAEAGVEYGLLCPDGTPFKNKKGEQLKIKLHGFDSDKAKQASEIGRQERNAFEAGGGEITAEYNDTQNIRWIARMTKSWTVELADGKPAPETFEAFIAFYTVYPTIKDQVDAFIGRRANFINRSQKV